MDWEKEHWVECLGEDTDNSLSTQLFLYVGLYVRIVLIHSCEHSEE